MQILCSGPGPHDPPDGVLGTADKVVTGMRCGSPACALADDPTATNAASLRAKTQQALAVNATYLGLASPSAAQTTAQVKALTRECDALIRLLLGALDDTSGT
jgi:hypothetical protein